MSTKLVDLIEHPEILEHLMRDKRVCSICKSHLDLQESRLTDLGEVCEDCYFEALGELIEQHPICSPNVRRG